MLSVEGLNKSAIARIKRIARNTVQMAEAPWFGASSTSRT